MNTLSYKTLSVNRTTTNKQWVVVDASEQTLGRLASKIAKMLRGKHKSNFTPHVDCGDNVVVINAKKIQLTGNKWREKKYIWHTGYPGGQKSLRAQDLFKKKPLSLLERAIKGMLPKNRLGRTLFSNLYLYEGENHKQQAQKPKSINIDQFN